LNPDRCAVCGSSWGSFTTVYKGRELHFCCAVCAKIYRNVSDILEKDGNSLLEFSGSNPKRVTVRHASGHEVFEVLFDSAGNILRFHLLE